VVTRTETVPQPVTSLVVDSYGGQVQVASGPVSRVQVTETIMYDQQTRLPAVLQSVSGGRLALSSRACASTGCSVDFRMTVPPGVTATVSTGGGPVTVSGIAGANLDSGGGPELLGIATDPAARSTLMVSSGGGPLRIEPAPRLPRPGLSA
jgi:hypothetical protein